MTRGEYRVGVNFNPGGNQQVDWIKRSVAKLIDELEQVKQNGNGEAARCAALAQTGFEDAAMWAVKAVTKPPEDEIDG